MKSEIVVFPNLNVSNLGKDLLNLKSLDLELNCPNLDFLSFHLSENLLDD